MPPEKQETEPQTAADRNRSGQHEFAAELLQDVKRLAFYAVQTGQLPEGVDIAKLCSICRVQDDRGGIDEEQMKTLAEYYRDLESRFPGISARSLRSTESAGGKSLDCDAGRYLRSLWLFAFGIVLLILASKLLVQPSATVTTPALVLTAYACLDAVIQVIQHLEPFTYGALGSCAYLLRVTERRLRSREFDTGRIPEHWNRLVLGTLSGGVIVLLIDQLPNGLNGVNGGIQLTDAALGFLAGYSVDFLFDTVDRVIRAMLPKVHDTAPRPGRGE